MKHQWKDEECSWLGTMPDADVAHNVGVSTAAATQKRRQLGIPAYKSRNNPHVDQPDSAKTRRVVAMVTPDEQAEYLAQCDKMGRDPAKVARALIVATLKDL